MRCSVPWAGELTRWVVVGLGVAAAALVVASPAVADAEEPFRKGMEAWDEERWADVVLHMRTAIQEKSTSGGMVRLYGTRFEEYLPHFYMGMAFQNIGACQEAVTALEESKRQGQLGGRQRREMEAVLQACRDRLPPPPPPPPVEPESLVLDLVPDPPPPQIDEVPLPPPPPPPPEPSPTLRQAADAFLAGDYARTLRLLDSAASEDEPKERSTRHLLRAAAGYSLYLAGGRDDAALRRTAERDARAWRQEPAGIRAAPKIFSPAVRALLGDG